MPGVGVRGVGVTGGISLAARVAAMFRNSEQGGWYDPSDISTLYQDAEGTTPVTAMEQPVGLILDKSKGLVLGPELVPSGTFSGDLTGWVPNAGGSIAIVSGELEVAGAGANYFGGVTPAFTTVVGRRYVATGVCRRGTTTGNAYIASGAWNSKTVSDSTNTPVQFVFEAVSTSTKLSCLVSGATTGTAYFDNISVRELPGNHAYQATSASRPVLSARVNQYLNTTTLATQNVTTLATTYTLRFEGTGSITLSGTATGTYTAGTHSVVCTAGTLTSTVTGTVTNADLRLTNAGVNLPSYQRVTTSTDYDTAGFPAYLKFDGIDDFLVTNSIDFTATDKMTVCSGVRKMSDAAFQVMVELSVSADSNNGSFVVGPATPNGDASRRTWGAKLQGNLSNLGGAGVYSAPDSRVATSLLDIGGTSAATENSMRLNGVTQSLTYGPSDAGTGNFGNYPLYIGSRAGTSNRYNGHIYSLIVRGAQSSDAQIASVERYVNGKTKAYA